MNVLLVAEVQNGALNQDATAKALTAARQLGEVTVLCADENAQTAASQAAQLEGVSKVLQVSDARYGHGLAETTAALVQHLAANYEAIVFPATSSGKNIAPRVAALLDVMILSDVMAINGANEFVRPIYAGNILQTVESTDAKKVMTIRTASFTATGVGGNAAIETLSATDSAQPTHWVADKTEKSDRPDLTSAKIIVSGGRGLGSKDNFDLVINLADRLNAAVGASRAAVDAGFAPNDWQVGQTGKIVAPDLYMAIGISGAIQHLAGMKDSRVIVAINKDEEAPIFQVADYGLVADLFEAIPAFEKALG